MTEPTIPKEIRRGMRFTTSWSNNKYTSWLLIDVLNRQAFLKRDDGTVFTTNVEHLRIPFVRGTNSDHFIDSLAYAHRNLQIQAKNNWRLVETKSGTWSSGIKEQLLVKTPKGIQILNQENMELKITKEKVLEAAAKCPQAKTVLETMFPDVFEDNTIFCEIGAIFFRKKYPNNIYAVVKHDGKVIAMNITNSSKWNEDKAIVLRNLKDWNCLSITVSEFRKLTGYKNLDEFTVIPRSFNPILGKFVELNKHKL